MPNTTPTNESHELIGKEVFFVDMTQRDHYGVIVAIDEVWLYCQSYTHDTGEEWDFRVKLELYDAVKYPSEESR